LAPNLTIFAPVVLTNLPTFCAAGSQGQLVEITRQVTGTNQP